MLKKQIALYIWVDSAGAGCSVCNHTFHATSIRETFRLRVAVSRGRISELPIYGIILYIRSHFLSSSQLIKLFYTTGAIVL